MTNAILYYSSSVAYTTAITLVVHGLNVQPLAMLPLIQWLNSQGSDVYLIQLSGHYEGAIAIKEVTAAIWQQEMLEGYKLARKAANAQSLPLYFLGYSLGALLGQSMLLLYHKQPAFEKQVLIAPATAIRKRSYLLKLLFFFGKQFQLPSYTPKDYRFNKRLPLLIYKLLFDEEKKMKDVTISYLNIPSLIIIDPKDELISYMKLLKSIKRSNLNNYQLLILNSNRNDRKSRYHHLIINEETMGTANWRKATTAMKAFLFE